VSGGPISAAVAAFVAGGGLIDDAVRERAGLHVLDTLAAIVAGRDLAAGRVGRAYAVAGGGDCGSATIAGTSQRTGLVDAVFAGAMAGHAAEVNDFMPSVFVQPGPAIVATSLGVAEGRGLGGAAVVRAVVVGYELAARVPRALGVANLRAAGLASHGVGPTFGSAAAAASLLGLPADRVGDVLACCAQQASGSWQWLRDVEHIEKAFVFAGMGARNGLQAALLVEAGFRGVREAFDDPAGWFHGPPFRGGDRDTDALVLGLDRPVALHDTATKRHPVGGPAQPAVEALLDLLTVVDACDVERVVVAMPGRADAFRDAAMPALNLRYLTAVILLDGRLGFEAAQSLDRFRHDEAVAARMVAVEVVHDPDQEVGTGRHRVESARVTVTLGSGEVHERFVGSVAGYPTHPMTRAEIEAKAHGLLAPHLGERRADRVIATCARLEGLDRAADLLPMIAR
jgi:2-methylcitrate dehydratase PrpD